MALINFVLDYPVQSTRNAQRRLIEMARKDRDAIQAALSEARLFVEEGMSVDAKWTPEGQTLGEAIAAMEIAEQEASEAVLLAEGL